ncbi:hypothetical protein GF362_03330 [Candidatus Dojkabacteria bacterium]|nr:hypothetical protein [Candidatus Dojkabacteria bacterium]
MTPKQSDALLLLTGGDLPNVSGDLSLLKGAQEMRTIWENRLQSSQHMEHYKDVMYRHAKRLVDEGIYGNIGAALSAIRPNANTSGLVLNIGSLQRNITDGLRLEGINVGY